MDLVTSTETKKELRGLCFEIIKLFFGVELDFENDIEQIPEYIDMLGITIKDILVSEKKDQYLQKYMDIAESIDFDYLQDIFQEFKKDRKNLNQDYTPKSAAKLLAELVYYKEARTVYDVCCGSGSLSIALHNIDKDLNFVCWEYDENVIPYLLFNLAIRNINAVVIRGDIFTGETFDFYELKQSTKFSDVSIIENYKLGEFDICVSNPPFNVKGIKITNTEGFNVDVNNDSNSFFVNHLLKHSKKRAAIIFPMSFEFSTAKGAIATRKYIIDNRLLTNLVKMPEKLFEYTTIVTDIVILDKENKDYTMHFLDAKNWSSFRIRDLRGSYGGKSHTNRVYHKKFSDFSDENITQIKELIEEGEGIEGKCGAAVYDTIKARDYNLSFKINCPEPEEEKHFRSYAEIFADLANLFKEEKESIENISRMINKESA